MAEQDLVAFSSH